MQIVEVPELQPNNATYSQAVRVGGLIFVSGQIAAGSPGGMADQTRRSIESLRTVLIAAGSGLERVVKVNIFLTDFRMLGEMNAVYAEYFPHRPAKTTVEIARLDRGALIEIEAVAEA